MTEKTSGREPRRKLLAGNGQGSICDITNDLVLLIHPERSNDRRAVNAKVIHFQKLNESDIEFLIDSSVGDVKVRASAAQIQVIIQNILKNGQSRVFEGFSVTELF